MSVITLNTNVVYVSTGSAGPYTFNFPISDPDALTVLQNNVVQPSTAYTLTPVNNNYDNGGIVMMNNPVPAGQELVLQRTTPLTQESVFTDNMPNPMQQFEDALDKLTEIVQELAANQSGGSGQQTYVVAGTGITVTGTGTITNPYVVELTASFAILTFTGGQAGEIGQSFVNPSFAASYSGTPTGATITNTAGIDSPYTLSSPYTSGALTGTFTSSTPGASITFTLQATNGASSPTATQVFTFNERIFAGLGAADASSSVTASGNNAVLSTGDVIQSAGLGAEYIGQTFGPFTPNGQCIYLLLTESNHTFTDAISGFPLPFNTPTEVTFVNQYGVSVSMWLYQTTNILTGPPAFQPRIAS